MLIFDALLARLVAPADAAPDGAFAGTGIDQAVPAHGRVGGHLPAEQLAVELLRPLVVRAEDLEARSRLSHLPSPFGNICQ